MGLLPKLELLIKPIETIDVFKIRNKPDVLAVTTAMVTFVASIAIFVLSALTLPAGIGIAFMVISGMIAFTSMYFLVYTYLNYMKETNVFNCIQSGIVEIKSSSYLAYQGLEISKKMELFAGKAKLVELEGVFKGIKDFFYGRICKFGNMFAFIDKDKNPTKELRDLLKLYGMDKAETASFQDIISYTQDTFIRKGERWDAQQDLKYTCIGLPRLLTAMSAFGIDKEVKPIFDEYDGAIVHGARASVVLNRLCFLVKLWNEGVRFKSVIFMSGDRPLDSQIESMEQIRSLKPSHGVKEKLKPDDVDLQTESQLLDYFLSIIELPFDPSIIICQTVSAKGLIKDGVYRRPTTDDAIAAWMEMDPCNGRYIAVSNAPYIDRQGRAISNAISHKEDGLTVETVGPSMNEGDLSEPVLLDELARTLYSMKHSV